MTQIALLTCHELPHLLQRGAHACSVQFGPSSVVFVAVGNDVLLKRHGVSHHDAGDAVGSVCGLAGNNLDELC